MKNQIRLITAAAALAFLASCSENTTKSANADSYNIQGTTSAAQEEVTVLDADGVVIADDVTDADGAYSLDLPKADAKFPLTIRVTKDGDTLRTMIPPPEGTPPPRFEANITGLTDLAFDRCEGEGRPMGEMTREEWESRLDSSAGDWMEMEKDRIHREALVEFAPCMEALAPRIDSLPKMEGEMLLAGEALKGQLASGEMTREDFIRTVDSVAANFEGMMKPAGACPPPPPANCPAEELDASKTQFEALVASLDAGTITEEDFRAAAQLAAPCQGAGAPPTDSVPGIQPIEPIAMPYAQ